MQVCIREITADPFVLFVHIVIVVYVTNNSFSGIPGFFCECLSVVRFCRFVHTLHRLDCLVKSLGLVLSACSLFCLPHQSDELVPHRSFVELFIQVKRSPVPRCRNTVYNTSGRECKLKGIIL